MLVVGQYEALLVELQHFAGVSVGLGQLGELREHFWAVVIEHIKLGEVNSVGDDEALDGKEVLLLHGVSHIVLSWNRKMTGEDEHHRQSVLRVERAQLNQVLDEGIQLQFQGRAYHFAEQFAVFSEVAAVEVLGLDVEADVVNEVAAV